MLPAAMLKVQMLSSSVEDMYIVIFYSVQSENAEKNKREKSEHFKFNLWL